MRRVTTNNSARRAPVEKPKRWLAVGCSHGHLADPAALRAVLEFRDRWRPETVIHLGDFLDLAALRAGARRDPDAADRARSIREDFDAGFQFLRELRPQHILFGNHEARLDALAASPNACLAYAAQAALTEIGDVARELGAQVYPYDIARGVVRLGDAAFLHGYQFNVSAIRDTAETYGRCVLAHLHRVGVERGRRSDSPSGYCVGTLMDIARADYARARRNTWAWSQGFAFGEYASTYCAVHLVERTPGHPWNLPL